MIGKRRIGNMGAAIMIGIASVVDIVEFLLVETTIANSLTTIVSWAFFVPWFYIVGVTLWNNPKLILRTVISFLVGAIPVVGALIPEFTIGIILILIVVRLEDITHLRVSKIAGIKAVQNIVAKKGISKRLSKAKRRAERSLPMSLEKRRETVERLNRIQQLRSKKTSS